MAQEIPSSKETTRPDGKDGDPKNKDKKAADKKKGKHQHDEPEELSDEDQELKNSLDMIVERLSSSDTSLYPMALQTLLTLIRTSTSSMTSVPKPLKFLKPNKSRLVQAFNSWPDGDNKKTLADVLSVLAMADVADDTRETLSYRLKGGDEDLENWGHEYVRHLSAEVGQEYAARTEKDESVADLMALGIKIVPFFLKHHAEADAVDLLLELEAIDKLPPFIDETTYERVCLYMISCVPLLPPPDDQSFLKCVHTIYRNQNQLADALIVALKLNDMDIIRQDFDAAPKDDPLLKQQLCFLLARHGVYFEIPDDEVCQGILNNSRFSEMFIQLARELEVLEPKTPEDIYKTHLENNPRAAAANAAAAGGGDGLSVTNVDSAKHNLASTFVNAFVNVGFGNDKLILGPTNAEGESGGEQSTSQSNPWIYKNKEHGMMSAAASVGCVLMWDVDMGLSGVDKYLDSSEHWIKAGALLAIGILNRGVRNDSEPALALLTDYAEHNPNEMSDSTKEAQQKNLLKISSMLGLGIAYAGTEKEVVMELVLPSVSDASLPIEVSSMAALTLGLVFIGSCHGGITSTILQALMELDPKELKDPHARFMSLGLALLFLGKQDASDAPLEAVKTIEHPIGKQTSVLMEICSYAGTGNVLKVQEMLHLCTSEKEINPTKDESEETPAATQTTSGEGAISSSQQTENGEDKENEQSKDSEKTKEKEDDLFQQYAVLGVALVAMGEDTGAEMALRTFNHLMHYGDPAIRKAVPLALGLLCTSNPMLPVLDTLSKYSHDSDADVSINAIFAMGLVGAGTNHARLSQMLRQLASYYYKDASQLFVVRVAQGLIHLGKGTMTLNAYYGGKGLMSRVCVAGLLTTVLGFTDSKNLILGKMHYMLYALTMSLYPRFLITLDENLKSIPISVRVGQAVDTVGQAGKPKTITGFQTHSTPVLLAQGERAELATEEYIPMSKLLEGFVIVKKNPDWMEEEDGAK